MILIYIQIDTVLLFCSDEEDISYTNFQLTDGLESYDIFARIVKNEEVADRMQLLKFCMEDTKQQVFDLTLQEWNCLEIESVRIRIAMYHAHSDHQYAQTCCIREALYAKTAYNDEYDGVVTTLYRAEPQATRFSNYFFVLTRDEFISLVLKFEAIRKSCPQLFDCLPNKN